MDIFDVIILIGIVQGILLGLALLTFKRGNRKANGLLGLLMITFSLSISHFLLSSLNQYVRFPHLMRINQPLVFLFGPLLYFYVSVLIRKNFQFRLIHSLHMLPYFLFLLYLTPFYIKSSDQKLLLLQQWQSQISAVDLFIESVQVAHLFVYIYLVNRKLKQHEQQLKNQFSSIDKTNLHWVRSIIAMLLGVFILIGLMILLGILGGFDEWLIHYGGKLIAVLVSICIYAMGYLGLRQPEIFIGKEEEIVSGKKYQTSPLTPEQSRKYLEEIKTYFEVEKPYLNSLFKLADLAKATHIPAYQVSQVINEQLNMNFFELVNSFRIREVQRRLASPEYKAYSILAIAYDVGFNSKSAFNQAFLKYSGMTPSRYRRDR